MLYLQEEIRGLEDVHLAPARHGSQYLVLKRNHLVRLTCHVSLQEDERISEDTDTLRQTVFRSS